MNERSWSRKLWHRNWKWKHTRKLNMTILPSLFPKISVTFSSKTIQTNSVSKQAFKYINTLCGSICWCVDHRCGLGEVWRWGFDDGQIVALRVTSHPLFQMTLREAGRTRIAGTYSVRFLGIKVVDFSSVTRKYG